jgi:5-methylcytosine-specific restriction endonuclease McrA
MNGVVLVLNQNYEPLNVTNLPRAFRLVFGLKAEILEYDHQVIRTVTQEFHAPAVIRLQHHVRRPRPRVKLTRREVFARDRHTCQYCGRQASGLTVDHVIPRSRGGDSVWENIVASCAPCNRKKGNRLPREVSMHPRSRPKPPGPTVFIRIASPRIPVAWEPYLVTA